MGSKKIPANTPLTYQLEVLECNGELSKISEPTGKRFHKKHDSWLHSQVKPFNGDNTHDKEGNIRRNGGGPAKDYIGEVTTISGSIKSKDVSKLKQIVSD